MKLPRLIGLAGVAGSGKDTVASFIKAHASLANFDVPVQTYAFADPLKKGCSEMFGIPLDHFYDRERKEKEHDFWDYSPRWMLQHVGTNLIRRGIDEDFWIKRADWEWNDYQERKCIFVVTDIRFENEAEWVRNRGGEVWHITRPELIADLDPYQRFRRWLQSWFVHASEKGVTPKDGDYEIINDDTVQELSIRVGDLLWQTIQ